MSKVGAMAEPKQINEIVRIATTANLSADAFVSTFSAPTTDSEGREALEITIVLTPRSSEAVKGDAVLTNLVQIQRELQNIGEQRFPIIQYATQEELSASDDS